MMKIIGALVVLLAALMSSFGAEPLPFVGMVRIEDPQLVQNDCAGIVTPGDRIRISSYNIQDFLDAVGDGPDRTPERLNRQARGAAALLDRINPDVAVFMEIENGTALQVLNRALKKPFPVAYITDFHSDADQNSLNIAVLSRFDIHDVREIDFSYLSGAGRPTRGFLSFDVDLGQGRRLLLYAVHLKSNWGKEKKNENQRRYALMFLTAERNRFLRNHPDITWETLIAGDTNVDPEDPQFEGDTSFEPLQGWLDLWRGRPIDERVTCPTRYGDPKQVFPPVTFDRFFASRELGDPPWVVEQPQSIHEGVDTNNIKAVGGENDIQISDHYPIFVDIVKQK